MAKFSRITTGNPDLDRVQQRVEELAAQIPAASTPVIVTVTKDYTVTGREDVIHVDAQRGPVKVTLGKPSTGFKPLTVKQTNTPTTGAKVNPVTVATADGSAVIGGSASVALDLSGTGSVSLTCDGRQYWPNFSGGAGSSSSGAAQLQYVPGDGISIAGNVISSTVTGGTTNVRGQFPIRSTGGPNPLITKSPWLNDTVQYVAPGGDDANDGLGEDTAKQHGYNAAQVICAAGGGTVVMAEGAEWGGPVPGQGQWFRGDGMAVPGFLPDVPIIITGTGKGTELGFGSVGQATVYCGGNFKSEFRTKPGIWLVRTTQTKVFEDMYLAPSIGHEGQYGIGLYQPVRSSMDYHRNADGSIRTLPTTSSSRAVVGSGWHDTHVVTLPAGIPIQSATRSGAVVTVVLPAPAGMGWPPWRDGTPVWINSTDANFPAGMYEVINCQSNLDEISQWGFQYVDGGSGTHTMSPVGTVCSPACQAGDLVDTWGTAYNTPVQFPSTQYQVVSVTVNSATQATIVLNQLFGGFNGPDGFVPTTVAAAPFGITIVPQERQYACCTKRFFDGVWSLGPADVGNCAYAAGPNWDIGGDRAFQPEIKNAYMNGFYYPLICPYDRVRMSSVSMYPTGGGSSGVTLKETVGGQASVVATLTSQLCQIDIEDGLLFDTNNGFPPPPLDIQGNGNTIIRVKGDFLIADGTAEAVITGCNPFNIQGISYKASTNGNWLPSIQGQNAITQTDGSQQFSVSPWVGPVNCVWTNKLLYAGGHPAAWRNISPASARFANLWPAPASWSPPPTATGIDDPGGGTGGVRYDDTIHGSGTGTTYARTDSFFAVGGRMVMGGWVRCNGGGTGGFGTMGIKCNDASVVWRQDLDSYAGHPTGRASDILFQLPFGGDGWMFWFFSAELIATGSATLSYTMQLFGPPAGSGNTTDFFGVTACWVPPGISANDIMEYVGTLRGQPYYLQPGQVGTFENQKFIAHGGLGVDSSIPVTPTGTGTPTKNLPLLQADGTVQGYIPVLPTNSELRPYTMVARYVFADQALVGSGVSPTVWLMAGTNQFNPDATRSEYSMPFAPARCLMYATIDGGVLGHDITFQLTKNGSNVSGGTVVIPSGSVGPATPVTATVVLAGASASDTWGLTESAAAGTGTWSGSVTLWFQ